MNKIRIESKTSESGYTSTRVYFDDHEITGIVKIKLEQDITMHVPVLSLDIGQPISLLTIKWLE